MDEGRVTDPKTWLWGLGHDLDSIAARLGVSPNPLRVVVLIRSVALLLSNLEASHWARYDLGAGSGWVLIELALQGPSRPSDLAASFLITPGGMSQILSGLERKGLVVRSQDPTDRRSVTVTLSEKGKALFERQLPELREAVCKIEVKLGEARLSELCNALHEFICALGSVNT